MSEPRVAVCVPTYGYQPVHAEIRRTSFLLGAALDRVQAMPGLDHLLWKEDLYVSQARNELIRDAIEQHSPTHLLFLDADVAPPRDAIPRLLDLGRPFVSGLYFQKIKPHHPVAGSFADTEMGWEPLASLKATPQVVDIVGGGCLLLEVRKLLEVASLDEGGWFDVDSAGRGEDLRFCRKIKAAGFKMLLDPRVECAHVGSVVITREYWERFK